MEHHSLYAGYSLYTVMPDAICKSTPSVRFRDSVALTHTALIDHYRHSPFEMDSLKNFISECGEAKSAAGVEPVALVEAVTNTGTLLITACNDFENATSKTPLGLEEPHVIQLPGTIRQCFSSSSSFHSFILSGEGKLYAFGRNDRGQLGKQPKPLQVLSTNLNILFHLTSLFSGTGDLVTYSYPVELPNIGLFPAGSKIIKIATGRSHSLILLESGDVYGCGANTQGQLGLGDSKVAIRDSLRFVKILSLVAIRDISCGYDHSIVCDRSGRLLTFGHPQYGQLGHGTDGSFIKDGGKGAAMQFRCIFSPRQIEKFVVKDSHGKLQTEVPASEVNIRLVAAGKNHSVCVEEWENNGRNKVYSFGFGGYGRLGHNSGTDEFYPREITTFQSIVGGQQVTSENFPQKQIHQIVAGSTYTMAISKSKHLYFWGKLSNSQRGEAVMYPKMEMNLYGWNTRHCAGGSNSVFVAADASCVAWGVPVAVRIYLFRGFFLIPLCSLFHDSSSNL